MNNLKLLRILYGLELALFVWYIFHICSHSFSSTYLFFTLTYNKTESFGVQVFES